MSVVGSGIGCGFGCLFCVIVLRIGFLSDVLNYLVRELSVLLFLVKFLESRSRICCCLCLFLLCVW